MAAKSKLTKDDKADQQEMKRFGKLKPDAESKTDLADVKKNKLGTITRSKGK